MRRKDGGKSNIDHDLWFVGELNITNCMPTSVPHDGIL